MPGPFLARNLPTGVSGPSGASSSTWFSPTSSSTASTPCSVTVSRWTSASHDDQVEAVRSCRLDAAVRAAKMGGVHAAPYFSGRYNAVAGVDGETLYQQLTRWFDGHRHAGETIGDGCQELLRTTIDL